MVLPFTAKGIYRIIKTQARAGWLLAVWAVSLPILVSAPVSTQRRLAEGIWVVLIVGLVSSFQAGESLPFVGRLLTVLLLPTSVMIILGALIRASSPLEPSFVPAEEVNAFLALGSQAPPHEVVLSDFSTGNRLPAWAPVRVVIGHGPETVHLKEWQAELDASLTESSPAEPCSGFFFENRIQYLFWGPAERKRWDWDPDSQSCLKRMYNSEEYTIYTIVD
jgi:hypothetical protein